MHPFVSSRSEPSRVFRKPQKTSEVSLAKSLSFLSSSSRGGADTFVNIPAQPLQPPSLPLRGLAALASCGAVIWDTVWVFFSEKGNVALRERVDVHSGSLSRCLSISTRGWHGVLSPFPRAGLQGAGAGTLTPFPRLSQEAFSQALLSSSSSSSSSLSPFPVFTFLIWFVCLAPP